MPFVTITHASRRTGLGKNICIVRTTSIKRLQKMIEPFPFEWLARLKITPIPLTKGYAQLLICIDEEQLPLFSPIYSSHSRRPCYQNTPFLKAIPYLGYRQVSIGVFNPNVPGNGDNYGIFHDTFPLPDMFASIQHKICKARGHTHCTQGQSLHKKRKNHRISKTKYNHHSKKTHHWVILPTTFAIGTRRIHYR
ncbi:hypothetical protein [Halomonas sp. BN3-1]|uniref:hypothetical protein n=1 Tax=unclassified Halomonas TaxID=2609666 RepID=UPI0013B47186|nr:hypothetical protein [Halomonas sp. BN3-1]